MNLRGNNKSRIFLAVSLLCLALLALTAGCDKIPESWQFWHGDSSGKSKGGKHHSTGTVIARVGEVTLTLEELQASIPHEYSDVITQEQNIAYVRQWINTELLYQEALRLKVDHSPEIIARFDKMKKDLLSAEIINRGGAGGAEVSEQAIREYYERNREQFVRETAVARYEDMVVSDINLAWEIRRTATHETFRDIAKANPAIQFVGDLNGNTPYVSLDAVSLVVRNAIAGANVPSITGPYRSEEGFHILRLVNKFDKGTIATIDEVREEIVSRLSSQAHKDETERMIADIRSRADVEFNIDLIPGADVVDVSDANTSQD
jgi:hypothetical protein